MSYDEMQAGLELPSPRRTARLFGRAFRLRCPNCGGGPVLEHWLRLRVRCGRCGLRLQRGEHDYFTGSMFILFTLVGLLTIGTFMAVIVVRWPAVPWDLLQYGIPVLTIVAIPALFPVSKLVWLAFDLMLRPVSPEELEWHRTSDTEWSSVRQ
jgi:uncharacterized protein (DUF983 family)